MAIFNSYMAICKCLPEGILLGLEWFTHEYHVIIFAQ